ncbi:MAG: response regulator [Planctomycetales bacterium]|nr:response regulator [Planctomycetales bacterium]
MNALIVDDSKAMRGILRKIVRGLGFSTLEAGNGQEGLDQLHAHDDISLMLVDWNMPVMNGLELVRTVRSDKRFEPLRIVMVTTETEPARMVRALMSGVDEFVMKPFTRDILVEKLRLIGVKIPDQATAS